MRNIINRYWQNVIALVYVMIVVCAWAYSTFSAGRTVVYAGKAIDKDFKITEKREAKKAKK